MIKYYDSKRDDIIFWTKRTHANSKTKSYHSFVHTRMLKYNYGCESGSFGVFSLCRKFCFKLQLTSGNNFQYSIIMSKISHEFVSTKYDPHRLLSPTQHIEWFLPIHNQHYSISR